MPQSRRKPGRVRTRRQPTKANPDRVTYSAMYWDGDVERTLGTFGTYEEAEDAWVAKVAEIRGGMNIDPRKSRTTVRDFIEIFRERHVFRRTLTRQNVLTTLDTRVVPYMGSRQLADLVNDPGIISQWNASMEEEGLEQATRRTYIGHFSTALSDAERWNFIPKNPIRNLITFRSNGEKQRAFKGYEGARLISAMPGEVSALFCDVALNSGLRFGELTELRVHDVKWVIEDEDDQGENPFTEADEGMIYLHVQRNVAEVNDPEIGRFKIEPTPKGGKPRKVSLNRTTGDRLLKHIESRQLRTGDLVFPLAFFEQESGLPESPHFEPVVKVIPDNLGWTEPNSKGRKYRHGTTTAYGDGRCRCEWCKEAVRQYRARRRELGLDKKPQSKRPRATNKHGHLPRDYYRNIIFRHALRRAGLGHASPHDMRHTHATVCARKGVDVLELKERMGHLRIDTTMKYITASSRVPTRAAHVLENAFAESAVSRARPRIGRTD